MASALTQRTHRFAAIFLNIKQNKIFETIVVAVILFSALMIGAKTYNIPSQLLTVIVWLDYGITIFFLIEISIRFFA